MSDGDTKESSRARTPSRRSYNPFQVGYVPTEKKGYKPVAGTDGLPRAPKGGTGATRVTGSGGSNDSSQTTGDSSKD